MVLKVTFSTLSYICYHRSDNQLLCQCERSQRKTVNSNNLSIPIIHVCLVTQQNIQKHKNILNTLLHHPSGRVTTAVYPCLTVGHILEMWPGLQIQALSDEWSVREYNLTFNITIVTLTINLRTLSYILNVTDLESGLTGLSFNDNVKYSSELTRLHIQITQM